MIQLENVVNDNGRSAAADCLGKLGTWDDPLVAWIDSVRKLEKEGAEASRILSVLNMLTERKDFLVRYANDHRYLRLWITYAKYLSTCRSPVFSFLNKHGIGQSFALFYEAWATVLEEEGVYDQARSVYLRGLKQEVQPLERIQQRFEDFMKRNKNRFLRNETKDCQAEKRRDIPGYERGLVYGEGIETQFEEMRAHSHGYDCERPLKRRMNEKGELLGYDPVLVGISTGQEYQFEEHRAMENANLVSEAAIRPVSVPSYSSFPSPSSNITVNTKYALQEVLGMFNESLSYEEDTDNSFGASTASLRGSLAGTGSFDFGGSQSLQASTIFQDMITTDIGVACEKASNDLDLKEQVLCSRPPLQHLKPKITSKEDPRSVILEELALPRLPSAARSVFCQNCGLSAPDSELLEGDELLQLAGYVLRIHRLLGDGRCGRVFQVQEVSDREEYNENTTCIRRSTLALKVHSKAESCLWEFYISAVLQQRLPETLRSHFVRFRKCYVYIDKGFLLMEHNRHGSLLDVFRMYQSQDRVMDETLVLFCSLELLRLCRAMHSCGIVHGSLDLVHLMILDEETESLGPWSSDPTSPWNHKGLVVIGLEKGFDATLCERPIESSSEHNLNGLSSFGGGFQSDLVDACGVICSLLLGERVDAACVSQYRSQLEKKLSNLHLKLWISIFDSLNALPQDATRLQVVNTTTKLTEILEEELSNNSEKGRTLKSLLVKQNIMVYEMLASEQDAEESVFY